MYTVKPVGEFVRDMERAEKRGCDMSLLTAVVKLLAEGKKLERRYQDHQLKGRHGDRRECHIKPDWLLVYRVSKKTAVLQLFRTGTHSDLL
jgi:mRNA interferase YafQ